MIEAVAVVPAAPALVPELMGAAAAEVEPVREAARSALRAVAEAVRGATGQDARLLVVGLAEPGQQRGAVSHDVVGRLGDDTFGMHLELPPLVGGEARSASSAGADGAPQVDGGRDDRAPTPLLVARRLVGDVVATDPTSAPDWGAAEWLTLRPGSASSFAEELVTDSSPIGLVLVADGAAGHGPKAPRREDPRAQEYDDQVAKALSVADPVAFAELDPAVGRELGAEGADLWSLLEAVAADTRGTAGGWRGELTWRGAPYGVGWFVATWLR